MKDLFKTWLLLTKEAGAGGSSTTDEDGDDVDALIDKILSDGEEDDVDKEHEEEAPKKDPKFTKQFSKRLNEEREKIAKQLGFNSYDELIKDKTRKTISDAGYDPDDEDFKKAVEAAVKERLETDPELIQQRKLLEELKAKEAQLWEKEQLSALEKEYGIKVKSIADLDAKTKELMAKGLDLTDAYYIANKNKLKQKQPTGKEHLNPETGAGGKSEGGTKNVVTQTDIDNYRDFSGTTETDEEIRARLEKIRGIKK